jgi:hypothetical protein
MYSDRGAKVVVEGEGMRVRCRVRGFGEEEARARRMD